LQVTHGLGGTHLTGALYRALGKYGAPLREEGRANVVRVLAELAAEAKGLGMTLGLNPSFVILSARLDGLICGFV
jgi:D-psicose/D-tagatose/L-ribulose 3-epimerase